MNDTAVRAETQIHEALHDCKGSDSLPEAASRLWEIFRHWMDHPEFRQGECMLRTVVLNELGSLLSHDLYRAAAWSLLSDLAAQYPEGDSCGMPTSLVIAVFEVCAEPPEYPATLRLLFSLASNPKTRWATFAAYWHYPWRLRPHARKYSDGTVTEADCDGWLIERGLGE